MRSGNLDLMDLDAQVDLQDPFPGRLEQVEQLVPLPRDPRDRPAVFDAYEHVAAIGVGERHRGLCDVGCDVLQLPGLPTVGCVVPRRLELDVVGLAARDQRHGDLDQVGSRRGTGHDLYQSA